VTFRSRDRTDTKGEPCSIKRIETEALQRGADDLDVVIPDGATTKQVKQLFKNARYKGNQDRRLACASSPVLLIRFAQQDHYPWWFGSSPTTSGWGVLKDADKQEPGW
jgi:hypothetical protein